MVWIHLRLSNCDQFGAGANINLGCTGHSLCQVTAIIDYGLSSRSLLPAPTGSGGDEGIVCWPALCNIISDGTTTHLYAGHSFHIGAATTAAMAGVDAMIQTLGRWRSAAYVCAVCKDAKLSAVLARNAS